MKKYVVVYVDGSSSYLAKWIPGGKIYETVAKGDTAALRKLADELNGEQS